MMLRWLLTLSTVILVGHVENVVSARDVDFLRDVKPILVARCYRCHSSLEQEGNLRLDSAAAIRKGGDQGVIITPGKSADSRLLAAVKQTGDLKMPPEGPPLTADQIAAIAAWIDAGAKLPTPEQETQTSHWAFQRPTRPALSASTASLWSNHPVDQLIAAKRQEQKLQPVPTTPKHILLRRVYLDLTGLPPTPEEQRAFLADDSEAAYERVVDQLLASPQYGERWGRHWMDVWRYSDWDGYGNEIRESKPHIWRWRDWIVQSLNADVPYNQMVVEMIAADELAPDDPQKLRATGFLVRNWYKFNRNTWLDNTIEHTGKAFLGLTFNCARCHDHMYDPISQQDYYQLRAFFEPLDIRTDRVPGQADVNKDGLVRVFDAKAETPTFLFQRGNEQDPVKDKPLSPGLPRAFTVGPTEAQAVALPTKASYPGLQRFVSDEALLLAGKQQTQAIQSLEAAIAKRGTEAQRANQLPIDLKLESPLPPRVPEALVDADLQYALAERTLALADSNTAFAMTRAAADEANYAVPTQPNAKDLSLIAGRAERAVAVCQAEVNLLQAEINLLTARRGKQESDAKTVQAFTTAQAAVTAAEKALAAARTAATQPHENYTRFTPVYPATSTGRRSAFARWIAADSNPLTARVAVNHIWLRHFGTPLVPTMFDFGMNGKPPTNQPLLDWLAVELMESGWRMKHIHKLIVTSKTYRLQSTAGTGFAENQRLDPDNSFYWRANPRRMEAEVVRDATLSVSGSLDKSMGGPDLDPGQGFTTPRRSLYFRSSKEKKMTFLSVFDSPNVVECYRRSESIAPQQALALVNSSLTLVQSRILAKKLSEEDTVKSATDLSAAFVSAAFERVLCRPATADEQQACLEFLQEQALQLADAKQLTAFSNPNASGIAASSDAVQRARENLVHVLLNHNDFVTIR